MFRISVDIETYDGRLCKPIVVTARSESAAKSTAEQIILNRYGKRLICMQVKEISRI